jgi:hypothetical protein
MDWNRNLRPIPSKSAVKSKDEHWADDAIELPWTREQFAAIERLLYRPWFERVWVLQEVILTRDNAVLFGGNDKMLWKDFCKTILCLCHEKSNYIRHPYDTRYGLGLRYRLESILPLCNTPEFNGFLNTLERTRAAKCSDPRDRVFVLLSMVTEHQKHGLEPDYSKTTAEIYQAVALNHIQVSMNLSVLHSCNLIYKGANMPS